MQSSASFASSAVKSFCRKVASRRHLSVIALAVAARGVDAQSGDDAQCYGFAFGAWKPALDLVTAGHGAVRAEQVSPKAPGGRDWASDIIPNDTTLLLFPAWWPAGVQVTFARRPSSPADTVAGSAIALVADGGVTPPQSAVRLWRVRCR